MSPADPEAFDDSADDFPGCPDISDVPHREDEIATDRTHGDRPLGSFGLERHVCDLWDHVLANAA
jgi:hypothetical protein